VCEKKVSHKSARGKQYRTVALVPLSSVWNRVPGGEDQTKRKPVAQWLYIQSTMGRPPTDAFFSAIDPLAVFRFGIVSLIA
jgi:hypothetical protein